LERRPELVGGHPLRRALEAASATQNTSSQPRRSYGFRPQTQNQGWLRANTEAIASIELRRCSSARLRLREHPLRHGRLQFSAASPRRSLRQPPGKRCPQLNRGSRRSGPPGAPGTKDRPGALLWQQCFCPEQRAFGREGRLGPSHRSLGQPPPLTAGWPESSRGRFCWSGFGGSGDPVHPSAETGEGKITLTTTPLITVKKSTRIQFKPMKSERFAIQLGIPLWHSGFGRGGVNRAVQAEGQPGEPLQPPAGQDASLAKKSEPLPDCRSVRFCFRPSIPTKGSATLVKGRTTSIAWKLEIRIFQLQHLALTWFVVLHRKGRCDCHPPRHQAFPLNGRYYVLLAPLKSSAAPDVSDSRERQSRRVQISQIWIPAMSMPPFWLLPHCK